MLNKMQVAFIYNDIFRYSNFGSNHPVLARRVSNVYDFSKILPIRSKINFIYNEIADLSTLSTFHSKDYLEVLKKTELTQSISKIDSERYNLGTSSNPIFNEMYKRHATSAGALLLAVDLVVKEKYNYAFTPGSGAHHGKANMASGFCYINDIAVTILKLKLEGYKKILYLDMDAHYGDGVVDHFRKDPDVFTISIHQKDLWPRTGSYVDDKVFYTLNYPVERGFDDFQFKKLFDDTIYKKIIKYQPRIVLMQMGADSQKGDKMSALELSNNALVYLIKNIKCLCDKIVVMGGGGYNPWVTLRSWTYNLAELTGSKYPLQLNNTAIEFLKNIDFKVKPRPSWLNSIEDKPNIFF